MVGVADRNEKNNDELLPCMLAEPILLELKEARGTPEELCNWHNYVQRKESVLAEKRREPTRPNIEEVPQKNTNHSNRNTQEPVRDGVNRCLQREHNKETKGAQEKSTRQHMHKKTNNRHHILQVLRAVDGNNLDNRVTLRIGEGIVG